MTRFLVGDYEVDIIDIRFVAELREIVVADKPFQRLFFLYAAVC